MRYYIVHKDHTISEPLESIEAHSIKVALHHYADKRGMTGHSFTRSKLVDDRRHEDCIETITGFLFAISIKTLKIIKERKNA